MANTLTFSCFVCVCLASLHGALPLACLVASHRQVLTGFIVGLSWTTFFLFSGLGMSTTVFPSERHCAQVVCGDATEWADAASSASRLSHSLAGRRNPVHKKRRSSITGRSCYRVNAEKIRTTALSPTNKKFNRSLTKRHYQSTTGFPGGLRE